MAGGHINDPLFGETLISSVPPRLSHHRLEPLEGFFELTRRPSKALPLPRALLPESQRIKDTVRCVVLAAVVPGHRQIQQTQTLIVRFNTDPQW